MPRQIWPPGYPTETKDGITITRDMCQVYPNQAVRNGAYPASGPSQLLVGQVASVLGDISPTRTKVDGILQPARALDAYSLDYRAAFTWEDALLPPALAMGFDPSIYLAASQDTNQTLSLTGRFNQAAPEAITLYFTTTDGTATSAANDFTPFTRLAVPIAEGATSFSVPVTVLPRSPGEGNEVFYVDLVETSEGQFGTATAPAFARGPRATIQIGGTLSPLTLTFPDQFATTGIIRRYVVGQFGGNIRDSIRIGLSGMRWNLNRAALVDISGSWDYDPSTTGLPTSGYTIAQPNQHFTYPAAVTERTWQIKAGEGGPPAEGFPLLIPRNLPEGTIYVRRFRVRDITYSVPGLDDLAATGNDFDAIIGWTRE